jgi:uncharacterized membrane protein
MWDLSPRSAGRTAKGSARGARRVPGRRILTAGLGIGAVVATGAVAQASAHGDGFFSSGASSTAQHATMAAAQQSWAQNAWTSSMSTPDYFSRMSFCMPSSSHQSETTPKQMTDDQMAARKTGDGDGDDQVKTLTTKQWQQAPAWDRTTWRTMFDREWWSRHLTIKTFVDKADPTFNQLLGINDNGVVAGYYGSGEDATHPNKGYLVWPPYGQRNIVNHNVPGAVQTQEIGINDSAVQVGFSIDKAGVTTGFVRFASHIRTVHNPLSTAKPAVDQLLGINNRGVAAGFYDDANGNSHGYLYNVCNGEFQVVRIPVAHDSLQATGVNDLGVVTGFYVTGKVTHGFVIDHGTFKSIDLGNDQMTQPFGIDNAGDLVGSYVDKAGATHGFLWQRGHLRTIDVPHATGGTVVNGVNNRGQLVGFFTTADKRTIGFIAS